MALGKGKMKTKTKTKAKAKGKRPAKKSVAPKKKFNAGDFASCSVVRTLAPAQMNAMYSFDNFILADFQRAADISRNYQHYRMSGIRLTWKPSYDTFNNALGAPPLQKPYLYYMIDKAGAFPDNITLEGLKQAGARPHRFDESPVSAIWRPSVLTEDLNAAGAASATQYKVSPWLSTNANATNPGAWNPSRVVHQGIKWYIEEFSASTTAVQLEVEIQFQFKKPLFPSLAAVPAKGIQYAVIDQSPDGVEGGSDGMTMPIPT